MFHKNKKEYEDKEGIKMLKLSQDESRKTVTAHIYGELDHHIAKQIREEIDLTCQRTEPRELVLDFSELSFMDSSGIGLIMGRYRMMQLLSGRVSIVGAAPQIKKVLKLSGISGLVEFKEKKEGNGKAI